MNKTELKQLINDQIDKLPEKSTVVYYSAKSGNRIHRTDGPAIVTGNGDQFWIKDGKFHRVNGPACEYINGDKEWWVGGKLHREDGPAIEYAGGRKEYYLNGKEVNERNIVKKNFKITFKELIISDDKPIEKNKKISISKQVKNPVIYNGDKHWMNEKGEYHREDGPAIECKNGDKYWYQHGKYHREDGPAIEYKNGDKSWCRNGQYHREDGPAIDLIDGHKYWYLNGKCHREDGPAIEYASGNKEWWINGTFFSEKTFKKKILELKKKEILS